MVNFNLQSKPACMRKKKDTQGQTPKCEARKSKVVVGAEEAPIEFQSAIKAGLHAQIEGYTRAKAQMPNPPMGCGGRRRQESSTMERRATAALYLSTRLQSRSEQGNGGSSGGGQDM